LQTWKFKKSQPTDLEVEIARLLNSMKDLAPHSTEYSATADQVIKLQKLQNEIVSRKLPSADTMTNAAANLITVMAVLHYEHLHVVTSKAFGMIKNLR